MAINKTTEWFINRAKSVHGERFLYTKTTYVAAKIKVIITCHVHGDFEITPNNHLNGQGCKGCAIDLAKSRYTSNTEDFIAKARSVHGDKYDYSNSKYVLSRLKLEVGCRKHGPFLITP